MSSLLNSRLEAVLRVRGDSDRTIAIIKTSDEAVANLNGFAAKVGIDGLSIDAATRRIQGEPLGTFAGVSSGGAYINIDPSWVTADPIALALVLDHEARHTLQEPVVMSAFANPLAYAIARSVNEGDSQYSEWKMRRELIAAGISVADVPYQSLLGQQFDPINATNDNALRAQHAGQVDDQYRELVRAGASQSAIDASMTDFMASLNRDYSHPSTERALTYGQQDIRDYIAASCGLGGRVPPAGGALSYSYISPPASSDLQINPDGTWSGRLRVPAADGFPETQCNRTPAGVERYIRGADGVLRRVAELTDTDGDGVMDRMRLALDGGSPALTDVDGWAIPVASPMLGVEFSIDVRATSEATSGPAAFGSSFDFPTYDLRAIESIDGQAVVDGDLVSTALGRLNLTVDDVLTDPSPQLKALVVAADPNNADGFQPLPPISGETVDTPWYEASPDRLAGTISATQGRNGDGQINGGHEMFSDSRVDMAARGLHAPRSTTSRHPCVD